MAAAPITDSVRILFLVHNLAKTRHFESVIRGLTARRHTVVLAAARKRKPLKPTKSLHDDPRIEVITCPTRRVDRWVDIATPLRSARDYLRFFDPRYARSGKLAARAAEYAPSGLASMLERRPALRRHWKLAQRMLALAETVLPPDRYFELFLKAERADLLLVTPLVDFGSYQTDYVKAAHRSGVPVVFLPFSWDNLTNRGLVRVAPDRVLVWNDYQKAEAVDLHGVPADRVVVTGAPRFDDFFAMRPATTREAFCAGIGLPPGQPMVLYTCSSNFVAPREVEFVRRWIAELRKSPLPHLHDCGILVRPHPAHRQQWEAADLADLPRVSLWLEKCEMNADQGLYDSLYHAAAVVGLNTSAMIEAAIVGRPVFTIGTDEFAAGQQGTLHYRYLLTENGGILSSAASFDAHARQLSAALAGDPEVGERSRRFVERFVRPRGREQNATTIMIDEIERVAKLRKHRARTPLWHYPVRWSLHAASRPALRRGHS
ncbi:MAG TPA: hypothetical protein VN654_19535 [Vicinamibacterales bacterium]|nr:hypothetical protein [Vicinamibacterales bacterium]